VLAAILQNTAYYLLPRSNTMSCSLKSCYHMCKSYSMTAES